MTGCELKTIQQMSRERSDSDMERQMDKERYRRLLFTKPIIGFRHLYVLQD